MPKHADDPRLERLSEVLELVMELSELSRRELAERLGSDYPVRRIRDRHKDIRVGQVLRFADAVGLKPLELFRLALDGDDRTRSPLLRKLEEQSKRLTAVLGRLNPPPPGDQDSGSR